MTTLGALRNSYHAKLGQQVVRFSTRSGILYPNFADRGSRSSVLIASGIAERNRWKTCLFFGGMAKMASVPSRRYV